MNLIGEHTDYNDGFVLPLAIDRAVWIALRPRDDRQVVVHSVDYNETKEFSLDNLKHAKAGWIEYLKGTAWSLTDAGHTLPVGKACLRATCRWARGLSSSAALEMATARAFAAVGNLPWEPPTMAKLGQRAENQWVGVNCGIMDQMISAAGKANHALLIDCRSLATCGGAVSARHGGGGARHGDPPRAGRFGLQRTPVAVRGGAKFFKVKALRDVTLVEFNSEKADGLDAVTRRRALHVVTRERPHRKSGRGDAPRRRRDAWAS